MNTNPFPLPLGVMLAATSGDGGSYTIRYDDAACEFIVVSTSTDIRTTTGFVDHVLHRAETYYAALTWLTPWLDPDNAPADVVAQRVYQIETVVLDDDDTQDDHDSFVLVVVDGVVRDEGSVVVFEGIHPVSNQRAQVYVDHRMAGHVLDMIATTGECYVSAEPWAVRFLPATPATPA